MDADETDAQRNRPSDDGPVREAADTFKKESWEDIDNAGRATRKSIKPTSWKRKRTSCEDDDSNSDVPMACAHSKDPPSLITYGPENMSDSRAFQNSAKRPRRYSRGTVHGPVIAEDCRKILSAPQSRILRKRAPMRMALAKITKPIHCFSNPGQLQNIFKDYFLAISRLHERGLGYRSIGLENLSISANELLDGDTEGILTSLDGVDVCVGKKLAEALPSIVSTFPSRISAHFPNNVPFDGPLQSFLYLITIMASRHGICNNKCECECEIYDRSILDILKASHQTRRAKTLNATTFIESFVECAHPYFHQLKDYLRILDTPLFSRRIISIQKIQARSRASQVDIFDNTMLRGGYGEWWSEIILDGALKLLDSLKKRTGRTEEGNYTDKAISFDAYERDRLAGLPTCAMAKKGEELDWTRLDACLDASSPSPFIRHRSTTLRCIKDTAQYDIEKRLAIAVALVALATKTMILDAASFPQHFYPQRLPRRKRTPIRVALAKVTKPVTYFSNPRQLFDAVEDYNISIAELQGLELYHRLIGLENLSITAGVKPRKKLFEEPVGILTSLDGVNIGLRKPTEGQRLPVSTDFPCSIPRPLLIRIQTMEVIVNTLPARLAFPNLDLSLSYFDHRKALRQILDCLMWITTTRWGPYNDKCRSSWSSETLMERSPVYKWHLLANENWDGSESDIGGTRKKKVEIMRTQGAFEENVIKFIQPYFRMFKAHMKLLRTASYDTLKSFAEEIIRSDLTTSFLKDREGRMWWINIMASSSLHVFRMQNLDCNLPLPPTPEWGKMNEYAGFEQPEGENLRSSGNIDRDRDVDPHCRDDRLNEVVSVKSRDTVAAQVNPSPSLRHCSCAACKSLHHLSWVDAAVTANTTPRDRIQDVIHGNQTIIPGSGFFLGRR
ncbi:hypothetical protein ACEPAF_5535 [Sanghuangporus sanghuang]